VADSVSQEPMASRAERARVRADVTTPFAVGDGSQPGTDAAVSALRGRPMRTTGMLVGDYHLLERVACGGMSHVYLAERAGDRARVAIKVLHSRLARHPEIVARFAAEGDTARAAGHRGVVAMLGDGTTLDGVPYLVMELLDGECLAARLEHGGLEIGAVAAIGAQLADALAAVHAAGFVHCDLKPENAFVLARTGLGGWPAVKLLDFGVARRTGGGSAEIAGTPPYMAPEQWRGEPLDGRTDVYGLACVLVELLTGAPPFAGASLAQQSAAHQQAMPVAPGKRRPGVPEALDRLIVRALSKDPGLRPSMSAMASVLADLAFAMPPGALSSASASASASSSASCDVDARRAS
jgi:serine/threonine protein kinase